MALAGRDRDRHSKEGVITKGLKCCPFYPVSFCPLTGISLSAAPASSALSSSGCPGLGSRAGPHSTKARLPYRQFRQVTSESHP